MKIAVTQANGEQATTAARLEKYFLVPDNYNFQTNVALNVTSVTTLLEFRNVSRLDYKVFRASMSAYVAAVGFATLSAGDKIVAAKFFACTYAEQLSVLPFEAYVGCSMLHHASSIVCRQERLIKAQAHSYSRLAIADAKALAISAVNNNLVLKYFMYGIEGTLEGDTEGLFDWIEARTGTSFAATGMAAQSITPTTGTLAELVALIVATLRGEV